MVINGDYWLLMVVNSEFYSDYNGDEWWLMVINGS